MPSFDPSQKYDALASGTVSHAASSHQSLDWLGCQPMSTPLGSTCQKINDALMKTAMEFPLETSPPQLFEPQLMTNKNHFPPSSLKCVNMWWRAWGGRTTGGLWSIIAITITRLTITIQWHPAKPSLWGDGDLDLSVIFRYHEPRF